MKKLLALALALAMVLSLTACGGKADTPSAPDTTPDNSANDTNNETPPADGSGTESEAPPETGNEEDPLLLSFDFPNAGVGDDGTNNPPKYIVTLHGGVEVERQPGVESQIVKLGGFGTTSNASNSVGLNIFGSNGEDMLEFQLLPSLTWSDIEVAIHEKLDLRDDVIFHITDSFDSGFEDCEPQEFISVVARDDYGNMTNPDAGFVLYNPTENVLPFVECPVASILPGIPDGSAGDFSAESVYANLGEPACVQLTWDDSNLMQLKSVNYYWVCDGFYARYSNQFANYKHGGNKGVLRYIVDNPTVVEHYMSDVAAFLAE